MYIPLEAEEQASLFDWTLRMCGKHPELTMLYHIPNGGSRHKAEAANLKKQGVKSGVPDLCLPVPRGRYHGLYIEMKRIKGSKTSVEQHEWLRKLCKNGYCAVVCKGWEDAARVLLAYLNF